MEHIGRSDLLLCRCHYPQLRLAAEMVAAMVVPPPLPLLPLLTSPPPQLHTISEQSWMHDQLFRDDALSLVLYLKEN